MASLRAWKKWVAPSRLVPLLTIFGASSAVVLSLIKLIELSTADEIIIALLALVAIDALNERLNILEKIERKLSVVNAAQGLKGRYEMQTPVQLAGNATEICLCAIHGSSAILPYDGFYANKLKEGCNLRIILLDPDSSAVDPISLVTDRSQIKQRILSTLDVLERLVNMQEKGACEVRLANAIIPFSMLAADLGKTSGSMNVEYPSYKVTIDNRPHVSLNPADCPYWFTYYKEQFEAMWLDATPWKS